MTCRRETSSVTPKNVEAILREVSCGVSVGSEFGSVISLRLESNSQTEIAIYISNWGQLKAQTCAGIRLTPEMTSPYRHLQSCR